MEQKITELSYTREGNQLYYWIPRELDQHIAKSLCRELDSLIERYQIKELVLDFSKTEFMDSSGIGVVIGRYKTMKFHKGTIYVKHLGKRIKSIFKAAGLFQIVEVKGEAVCIE